MASWSTYDHYLISIKEWNVAEFDLTYTMRSVGEYMREQKTRKELLIFNYDIEEPING